MRVALLGFGNVARAFVDWLSSATPAASGPIEIAAVADSTAGVLFDSPIQFDRATSVQQDRALSLEQDRAPSVQQDRAPALEPESHRLLQHKIRGLALRDFQGARVVLDHREFIGSLPAAGICTLIESLPTNIRDGQPALDLLLEALGAGLRVVTVDKGPVVHGFDSLTTAALAASRGFAFTGTTGVGPPPEINGEKIVEIRGVLNGTTNYILTEIQKNDLSFSHVLARAQQEGIAEPDPRLDIEGYDTACKILILANSLMHAKSHLSEVSRTGIGEQTESLIRIAKESGRVIRLVGRARIWQGRVRVSVTPKLVGPDSPFFGLDGTSKAAVFRTESGREIISQARSGRDAISEVIFDDLLRVSG